MAELLGQPQFRFELPDLPAQPILIKIPSDIKSFIEFHPTSFEQKCVKYPLLSEPDLGVPIDLIKYIGEEIVFKEAGTIPPNPGELSDEDKELLPTDADLGFAHDLSEEKKQSGSIQIPWMRKGILISNDQDMSQRSIARSAKKAQDLPKLTFEDKYQQELQTFDFQKSLEMRNNEQLEVHHPTKEHLRAVEVHPLLPNGLCWGNSYSYVKVSRGAQLPMDARSDYALVKTSEKKRNQQTIEFFLPTPMNELTTYPDYVPDEELQAIREQQLRLNELGPKVLNISSSSSSSLSNNQQSNFMSIHPLPNDKTALEALPNSLRSELREEEAFEEASISADDLNFFWLYGWHRDFRYDSIHTGTGSINHQQGRGNRRLQSDWMNREVDSGIDREDKVDVEGNNESAHYCQSDLFVLSTDTQGRILYNEVDHRVTLYMLPHKKQKSKIDSMNSSQQLDQSLDGNINKDQEEEKSSQDKVIVFLRNMDEEELNRIQTAKALLDIPSDVSLQGEVADEDNHLFQPPVPMMEKPLSVVKRMEQYDIKRDEEEEHDHEAGNMVQNIGIMDNNGEIDEATMEDILAESEHEEVDIGDIDDVGDVIEEIDGVKRDFTDNSLNYPKPQRPSQVLPAVYLRPPLQAQPPKIYGRTDYLFPIIDAYGAVAKFRVKNTVLSFRPEAIKYVAPCCRSGRMIGKQSMNNNMTIDDMYLQSIYYSQAQAVESDIARSGSQILYNNRQELLL
ncbi:MAG: hypothetical protein EZS28_017994 [Streblomastix strix]|uniref:Uncharacterized protein n=1 Tax=Streblomastix strix TaxID=222440 RepID=A0A5J4VW21_9EUKA|nr:MAG: hypothetical protein EZS28_017994 [Streblomastix strix]